VAYCIRPEKNRQIRRNFSRNCSKWERPDTALIEVATQRSMTGAKIVWLSCIRVRESQENQ